MAQATVKECMDIGWRGEARDKFDVVREFEEEMMILRKCPSIPTPTVTRPGWGIPLLVWRKRSRWLGKGDNLTGRRANDQMNGWREVGDKSGHCEVARGSVEKVRKSACWWRRGTPSFNPHVQQLR